MNTHDEVKQIYRAVARAQPRPLRRAVRRALSRAIARSGRTMRRSMVSAGIVLALFGTTFANDELKLIYNGTAIATIADNAASTPITNIYVSLHTASPASGNQTTSEVSYTGYARQAVARTSGGWTVTAASVSPVADIVFPVSTSGTPTVTNFATGTVVSSTGKVIDAGTVTPSITISTTVVQTLTTGSTITRT